MSRPYQQPQPNYRKLDDYYKSDDIPLPLPIPNLSASISRYEPIHHRRPKEPLMYPNMLPPLAPPNYQLYSNYNDENIIPNSKFIPKSINDAIKLGFKKKNCAQNDEENATNEEDDMIRSSMNDSSNMTHKNDSNSSN
jgi:hypothetical protein